MASKELPNGQEVSEGDYVHFNTDVRGVDAGTEFIVDEVEDGVLAIPEDLAPMFGLRFADDEFVSYLDDDSLMVIES